VLRIRYLYLQAILRQEAGFFDSQEATTSEIINSISKDASHIQEVLSEKVQYCRHTTNTPLSNSFTSSLVREFNQQKETSVVTRDSSVRKRPQNNGEPTLQIPYQYYHPSVICEM